jgi:hypothetical protein
MGCASLNIKFATTRACEAGQPVLEAKISPCCPRLQASEFFHVPFICAVPLEKVAKLPGQANKSFSEVKSHELRLKPSPPGLSPPVSHKKELAGLIFRVGLKNALLLSSLLVGMPDGKSSLVPDVRQNQIDLVNLLSLPVQRSPPNFQALGSLASPMVRRGNLPVLWGRLVHASFGAGTGVFRGGGVRSAVVFGRARGD